MHTLYMHINEILCNNNNFYWKFFFRKQKSVINIEKVIQNVDFYNIFGNQ